MFGGDMDFQEGVGESSSPPKSFGSFAPYDIRNDVYKRLMESGNEEVVSNTEFRELLDNHFNRLPASYGLDINMDKVEDVLLHLKLLSRARDPNNRPVFSVQLSENFWTKGEEIDDREVSSVPSSTNPPGSADSDRILPFHDKNRDFVSEFEPCCKLGDLNLDVRKYSNDMEMGTTAEDFTKRQEVSHIPIHQVIFSTIDKPKLLSQLSALLSDIGLNIREAHVFSTTDGYSLDVFVVDGWPVEDTEGLSEAVRKAIARNEGNWSGSSHSKPAVEKALAVETKQEWEIDSRLIKVGERVASGSCGDLFRGVYFGQDVAVKVLRSENLNSRLEAEFIQEVAILRKVQHPNIVHFIGACTKSPNFWIITEYMPGGSLYDHLRNNHNILKLPQLVKYAIDVCKGMEYLHQNNIIHRDLKTANLLMDSDNVVKVADFGIARIQSDGGIMTAETGTYRWMAPEVLNHQPYDQKADVFSFAIVLWELVTAKLPYDDLTPVQAAVGVSRQGLRPKLPTDAHPKLLAIMQRCWQLVPGERPSFSQIKVELEEFLREIQEVPKETK